MNGKQLTMALVLAGLVGGAAGAAVSFAMSPKERPVDQPTAETARRLKSAEDELTATRAELAESRKSIVDLRERVTKTEIAVTKNAMTSAAVALEPQPGRRVVRVGRHASAAGEKPDAGKDGDGVVNLDGLDVGRDFNVQLAGVNAQMDTINGDLGSLGAGLELRKLPEDQRWQKAMDDLGLTWNQVEALKKAVADRDAAMKDANQVETKTGADGATTTISRPDPGKTAHAQADYQDRVAATLSADQKKNWQSKGYDHAFGSGGGLGNAMVMTFSSTVNKPGDAQKDTGK